MTIVYEIAVDNCEAISYKFALFPCVLPIFGLGRRIFGIFEKLFLSVLGLFLERFQSIEVVCVFSAYRRTRWIGSFWGNRNSMFTIYAF